MGVHLDLPDMRRSVASGGSPGTGMNRDVAQALTGATHRQQDYWIRRGLLGARLQNLGTGSRREFSTGDLEVLYALAQLAALGCTQQWMAAAADAVRASRVDPAGERLVVHLDGPAYRHPAGSAVSASGPLWLVPLRSFAGVRL